MTEKLRQSLSAAMDDEADAFELRRVLDELDRDTELRGLWDRYHLIGSALRGDRTRATESLRERIRQALEAAPAEEAPVIVDEPVSQPVDAVPEVAPRTSYLGRITGLAVAATVAFAVVLGFNGLNGGDAGPGPTVAAQSGPVVAPVRNDVAEVTAAEVEFSADVSPSDVQRAQAYMLHHTQQQALNQAGVMSFVKLATYEAP